MERYESYKDSGTEWIGEIPTGWKTRRLKFLGTTRSGMGNKKPDDFGFGYPFLSYKDVYSQEMFSDATGLVQSTEDDRARFSVKRGDSFFTGSSETIEELGFSAVCVKTIPDSTFNGFTIRFRPYGGDLYPEYSAYLFRSDVFRGYLRQRDNSITRANLSQQVLGDAIVVYPDMDDQQLIADYLDAKTSGIDTLVADCEREIELLREYRKAVISEAVTKGLDSDAPMKDSGIEWIGEIPEGWQIQKLKEVCQLQTGHTPPTNNPEYFNGDIQWFTPVDIQNNTLIDSARKVSVKAVVDGQVTIYKPQSILLVAIGASAGKVGFAPDESSSNQQITALMPNDIFPKWLFYAMEANQERLFNLALFTTLPILNNDYLSGFVLAIPTYKEQQAIVVYLDAKTAEIDSLIDSKQQMVDKLCEYRRSLISEAVTGKFKVPGV